MSCEALPDKNPERYRQYLNMFMKFKTDRYPKAPMNTALTEYAKYLRENNQTVATVRTYISAILHCFENENIPLDPMTQKGIEQYLSQQDREEEPKPSSIVTNDQAQSKTVQEVVSGKKRSIGVEPSKPFPKMKDDVRQ